MKLWFGGLALIVAIKAGLKPLLVTLFAGSQAESFVRYFVIVIFAGIVWRSRFPFFANMEKRARRGEKPGSYGCAARGRFAGDRLISDRLSPRAVPGSHKPEVIAKWGRAEQTEEILAGVRLMGCREYFLPSYDGLRLHGRLLQQPGAKGTILLFHGYQSGIG
ncbi:MAG: hypothetical protein ACLU3F_15195 [Blautia wexlerae]